MSGVFNRLVPAPVTAEPRETAGSGRLRLGFKAALLVGSAVLPATGVVGEGHRVAWGGGHHLRRR